MKRAERLELPLDKGQSSRLYWELARLGAFATGERHRWRYDRHPPFLEDLIALAILSTRYDPRLMAILIDLFRRKSLPLNPLRLKKLLREKEALASTAVIGEFVLAASAPEEMKDLFRYLIASASPVPTQLYYRNLYPLGGKKIEEAATRPLWAFKKWGFLAHDPPILKEGPPQDRRVYLYDAQSRSLILRDMVSRWRFFRLRDYLREINFSVSRQQALKDLKMLPDLVRGGRGRGTYYKKRRAFFVKTDRDSG